MKTVVWSALALAIACVVAGVMILNRPPKQHTVSPTVTAAREAGPAHATGPAPSAVPPEESLPAAPPVAAPAPPNSAPQTTPVAEQPKPVARAPNAQAQGGRGAKPPKEPLHDPLARDALALVGMDATAEAYWCVAINDPQLPTHERQDLIEDLNEEGLSDPKHPGLEDLPVILSRIRLIEAAGPYAMDQVNADAFDEAYKDLINLANLAMGGGESVR